MKINWSEVKVFIKPGATDMRKQINGLSAFVEIEFKKDPFSGNLFMFCNGNRRRLKVLYWDRNGFCLWIKRLERDRFPWPMTEEQCREITAEQFSMILDGIDFFNAHKSIKFSAAS